ncbi:hypothetical protein FM104_13565 [Microbacterium esteraromaticum]|uniref:Uncharacterized protein n=1 Tax=Microbacterium esteraromaticum TaxID=57043 RepID=A0A1R4KK74_9MICO|nr:hypothetical protein [Microbacterium esteraromaticum]SJN44751.1 hypothetical protein FM104_13565 [Microbacterium esteraromaticum]
MSAEEYDRRRDGLAGDVAGTEGTPEAIEAASIGRHRHGYPLDPAAARARGVEWVRPTDLLARGGSRVAGAGIDFQQELARRARGATADRLHVIGDRARRLPPLSAFGRGSAERGVDRGAVGMR